ncbi:hypothetical protein FSP39_019270 [Pinctada imbricata]|uniref:Uncharacterized protein n=1 Tax=Pinctada imbricata TaxID=66713 RepID=A0AA88YFS1_PINIB|nr:hypothetical protein FSP39_019270 [Pinctada imbricata]
MSFIMKHASNILRLFVIASSMMVTTVLSVIFLHTELNVHFVLSSICVIAALYLYNK